MFQHIIVDLQLHSAGRPRRLGIGHHNSKTFRRCGSTLLEEFTQVTRTGPPGCWAWMDLLQSHNRHEDTNNLSQGTALVIGCLASNA